MTELIHGQKPSERCFKAKNQIEAEVVIMERSSTLKKVVKQTNMSIKRSMADELRNMGLSEGAISRRLNIKAHYKGEK